MVLAVSALAVSLALLTGGCSGGGTTTETSGQAFQEGTLSSNEPGGTARGKGGLIEDTGGSAGDTLLRVEGGKRTRFSGLCTTNSREYVISGSPSRSYSFDEPSFSCRIKKQDPGGGNLKVTVISGGSTRSVQQTNAQGGVVNVSHDSSGDSS
jgi:hypothetical protein